MSFAVFLNRVAHQAEPGDTLGDLLAREAPDLREGLPSGGVIATDGRGIAVGPDALLHAGAIFLVRRSARATADEAAPLDR